MIGEIFLFISSTFLGSISFITTSLCWASKIAFDNPTYPAPATAIFSLKTSGKNLRH